MIPVLNLDPAMLELIGSATGMYVIGLFGWRLLRAPSQPSYSIATRPRFARGRRA